MSELRKVLDRAQTDFDFYLSVIKDPNSALAEYELNEIEREMFADDRILLWSALVSREVPSLGRFLGIASDEGPPSDSPPSDSPPSDSPPSDSPPSDSPPSDSPPSDSPPSDSPPSDSPPSDSPPSDAPPGEGPHVGIVTPGEGPPSPEGPSEGPHPGIGVVGPGEGPGVGVSPGVSDPPSPGIIGVIHFMAGVDVTVTAELGILSELMAQPGIARAVKDIRSARGSAERLNAVNNLMEEIG